MKYRLTSDERKELVYTNSHTFEEWKYILSDFFESHYDGPRDKFNDWLIFQLRKCLVSAGPLQIVPQEANMQDLSTGQLDQLKTEAEQAVVDQDGKFAIEKSIPGLDQSVTYPTREMAIEAAFNALKKQPNPQS